MKSIKFLSSTPTRSGEKDVDESKDSSTPSKVSMAQWMAHVASPLWNPAARKQLLRGAGRGGVQAPESFNLHLKYSERITATATSGVVTYYQYRADCYDPNMNIAGGQPIGFDQWMAFYKNYLVRRFRFKMKAATSNPATPYITGALASACLPSTGLAGTETVSAVNAMPWGRMDIINGIGSPPISVDSGWINVWDVLGMTEAEFEANVDVWGTASATAIYYAVWAMAFEPVNVTDSLMLVGYTEFELDVKFFNRVRLVIS